MTISLKQIGELYLSSNIMSAMSDIQLSDIADISSLESKFEDFLNKDGGGQVSGGISVLSGNYVQTNALSGVDVYSSSNAFVQAEPTKYGNAIAGSMAYCILSAIPSENALVISGDFRYNDIASKNYPTQDSGQTFRNGLGNENVSLAVKNSLVNTSNSDPCLSDMLWSLALFNIGNANFGHLTTIEPIAINGLSAIDATETTEIAGTKLSFDQLPADVGSAIAGKVLSDYINDFIDANGDNALYVRGFAQLGNQIQPQFIAQHVEGGSTKAIGKYTHAEGRDTIADGRYAHAEGTATIAGGVASHAEGQSAHALGRSSHAEGEGTRARGAMSHAEGYQSYANEGGAHAEGGYWLEKGSSKNFSGGIASGKGSHAEGNAASAIGIGSHAEGYKTKATNDYAHSEGYSSIASGQYGAHAEGHTTSADGNYAHAEGKQTLAHGSGAHAEGLTSIANVYGSHVEGAYGIGNGNYSHVEGGGDYATDTFALCSDLSTLYKTAQLNVLSGLSSYGIVNGYAKINDIASIFQLSGCSLVGNELCIYLSNSNKALSSLANANVNVQLFKKYAAGTAAHAEGFNTRALTSYAHAEGSGSYAEGYGTHAEGYSTHAIGIGSHAEGNKTYSIGDYSHAEGASTSAYGKCSHAAGYYTAVSNDYSWCWNGDKSLNTIAKSYASKSEGTFCINPKDSALSNVYIGSNNFIACVLKAIEAMTDDQKTQLKTALSVD